MGHDFLDKRKLSNKVVKWVHSGYSWVWTYHVDDLGEGEYELDVEGDVVVLAWSAPNQTDSTSGNVLITVFC